MESRRHILKTAALTAPLFAGRMRGANDRISIALFGAGAMGMGNLKFAMKQPGVQVTAICEAYQPALDAAIAEAAKAGQQPKALRDFREVLVDKSVDAVCISTPDHWHAYMVIEACKAGKDVWVEKPISVTVEEGQMMVEAARKYNRVVQAGLMQRSGNVFQEAVRKVRSGELGAITFVRTWMYGNMDPEGIGNPPDSDPPPGLDWDMWLGPAPRRPFNPNRFFKGQFRRFWDYAGGTLTDWGVHWLDIVQMAFDEAIPHTISAVGAKYYLMDNRETPDTQSVIYEYPGRVITFELRQCNTGPGDAGGISFHGTRGTMYVNRSVCRVTPEKNSDLQPSEFKASNNANLAHWVNFLECMKTRNRPICDIETGYRSTSTCILGNVAMRSRQRLDWDGRNVRQEEAKAFLSRASRAPWKLSV